MIISRYLAKEICQALLAVTFVLLLAFLCQQLVRYLNYVTSGKVPATLIWQLIGFEIPFLLALLLPLGLYLGIMLAYGRLYTDSEMPILQLSGFGVKRLIQLTSVVALAVAGIVLVLMLWINPWIAAKRDQVMASDQAVVHLIQTLMPGRFQASSDGRHVIYVETLSRNHKRAKNVFIAEEKKMAGDSLQNAWSFVTADVGYQAKDKTSAQQFFVAEQGYRYEGTPGENDYKIIQFKKYGIRVPENDIGATHPQDEALSTWQLWQEYQNPRLAAELQWRFSIGISAFLLALLAVPLSKAKPRHGRYLSLLPAILIYVVYVNLLFVARRFVEQQTIPLELGMWWVHGVLFVFIIFLMIFSSRRQLF